MMIKYAVLLLVILGVAACSSAPYVSPEKKAKSVANHVAAGVEYLKAGINERARAHFVAALDADPKSPIALNAMASLFRVESDDVQAEKLFKKSIKYDSKFSQARNNYGALLYSMGQYEKAIKHLKRAGDDVRYNNRGVAYENVGRCYLALENIAEAEASFYKASKLDKNLMNTVLYLSEIAFKNKDYKKSQSYYKRYLAFSRPPTAKSLWLGIRLERIFEKKETLSTYELTLREMFPASMEYNAYRASLAK